MTPRLVLVLSLCAALSATSLGCSGPDESPGGAAGSGSGGVAGSGGSAGSAGSGGAAGAAGAAPCSEPASEIQPGAVCVRTVTGRLFDVAGAAVPGVKMSVCASTCYTAKDVTDGHGAWSVDIESHIVLADYSIIVHGRPDWAPYYFPLPSDVSGEYLAVGDFTAARLPASGPHIAVKGSGGPAQTVTDHGLTLDVPAGVDVRLDVEDVALAALGEQLRVTSIPAQQRSQFVGTLPGVLALYAMTPFEASFRLVGTTTSASVRLSFDNDTGLAAGAHVEVLALGSYLFSNWIPTAEYGRVAVGTVSSDGTRIDLDPGESTAHLTWFALRALP